VATIERRGRFLVAEPLFERGPQVALDRRTRVGAGEMALVEFGPGRARALRELGSPGRARDVVEALLWDRTRGRGFGDPVERAAAQAAERALAEPGARRDLTEMATFTVDPATARDFDDAVSARREGDGVRIWIHIADVAAHVTPGDELDREAYRRANSTYVPGTVEPMLPTALSADACSLAPGVDRLAVTAEIELGAGGEVRSSSFYRSRIRSDARLDYDQLDEIFASRAEPPAPAAEPEPAADAEPAPAAPTDDAEELEETPRQRPEIPGADLIPDIVPESDEFMDAEARAAAEAEVEAAAARAQAESEDESRPIADAAIDLAAGARYTATGKRKTAVARVILKPGTGTYAINGKELDAFFPRDTLRRVIRQPLETVGYESRMDVIAKMHGGGVAAQAGALRHGISRALIAADPNLRGELLGLTIVEKSYGWRIEAASGHDDRVMALALAAHHADTEIVELWVG